MWPPPRVESKGRPGESMNKKKVLLRLTSFKLLSQIKENSINNFDCLTFASSVRVLRRGCSHRLPAGVRNESGVVWVSFSRLRRQDVRHLNKGRMCE